jgi:carbamoyl-phosphate synthase large subunit
MPKRTDIHKILIIGSGPIVIGQACEFDYSGTQACKALREEGYEHVLVNSNPATIMTDPEIADATYIEPLTCRCRGADHRQGAPRRAAAHHGRPDGLNLAMDLHRAGVLAKYGVELIGANAEAIDVAEDRELFKARPCEIGLEVPRAHAVSQPWRRRARVWPRSACRPSSAPRSRWAAPAAASPTTARISSGMVERGLDQSPSTRC